MDKQIIEILTGIQSEMKEFRSELTGIQGEMKGFRSELTGIQGEMKGFRSELKETRTDVKDIKETVNRIEASQTEDVIALLKVSKQNSEEDFHYLNTRITNIDKRVFNLENRTEG
jgi:chromosome segregation ATPase